MSRVACCAYRWIVITWVACLMSLAIVVSIIWTGTLRHFSLLLGLTKTCVATVTPTVTTFRGRLINSCDQLTDVTTNSFSCVRAKTGGMTFRICSNRGRVCAEFVHCRWLLRAPIGWRDCPPTPPLSWSRVCGPRSQHRDIHITSSSRHSRRRGEPYPRSMTLLAKSIQLGGVGKNVSLSNTGSKPTCLVLWIILKHDPTSHLATARASDSFIYSDIARVISLRIIIIIIIVFNAISIERSSYRDNYLLTYLLTYLHAWLLPRQRRRNVSEDDQHYRLWW